jgi:hypothetical protein
MKKNVDSLNNSKLCLELRLEKEILIEGVVHERKRH